MNADEIKVFRHLKSFGARAHTKIDLLALLERVGISVAVLDLDGLKHFAVFEPPRKVFFFDCRLPDSEFALRGFTTFVFQTIGGRGERAADSPNAPELREAAAAIVRRIISPAPIRANGAVILRESPRRRYHHIAASPSPRLTYIC